jgi:hypothetical protein
VFENRVLRRIFRGKREEATSDWRNLMRKDFTISIRHQVIL